MAAKKSTKTGKNLKEDFMIKGREKGGKEEKRKEKRKKRKRKKKKGKKVKRGWRETKNG